MKLCEKSDLGLLKKLQKKWKALNWIWCMWEYHYI